MKQYLLDTNVCAFLFRGKYGVERRISDIGLDNCHISIITYAELYYGCETSDDFAYNFGILSEFADNIDIVGIENSISTFASEKARLRRLGTMIDDFDLLIGSTAIAHGMTLVTENTKHLARLHGISIENWIDRH